MQHVVGVCEQEPGLAGLLVRPDGYVAWAADKDASPAETAEGLRAALADWAGTEGPGRAVFQ